MEKFFLKSKTIWGIFLMILPQLGPLLGLTFTADDLQFIGSTGDAVFTAVGALLAAYGRFVAQEKLTVRAKA